MYHMVKSKQQAIIIKASYLVCERLVRREIILHRDLPRPLVYSKEVGCREVTNDPVLNLALQASYRSCHIRVLCTGLQLAFGNHYKTLLSIISFF